jgi:hypothetical protein
VIIGAERNTKARYEMKKRKLAKVLDWKLRKYSRWVRLYMKRVRSVEREMGGPIESC